MELDNNLRLEIQESLQLAKDSLAEFMAEITLITYEWANLLNQHEDGEVTAEQVIEKYTEFMKPVLLRDVFRMMDPVVGPVMDAKVSEMQATLDRTRDGMV